MNADAEFIKLLKDEADFHAMNSEDSSRHNAKLELCLELLSRLGITYTPNSRKE